MATPLPELQPGEGIILSKSVVDSKKKVASSSCLENKEQKSPPILIFLYFHKAIRNELDSLHRLALAFATGQPVDIRPLFERYRFLRLVYMHHSNAEDEVNI